MKKIQKALSTSEGSTLSLDKNLYYECDNNSITTREKSNSFPSPKLYCDSNININDFDLISTLGEGAYAKVALSKEKKSGKLYAIKIMDRKHMQKVFLKRK